MDELLAITRALSDESRVRALFALRRGELCLCQIIEILGLAPSTVSRHIDVLERAGLVGRRTQGRWRFYRSADRAGGTARRAVEWVADALRDDPTIRRNTRRVREVRRRDLRELSACYRRGCA
jgi:DNA-binding transcriptional ArsR family regulator